VKALSGSVVAEGLPTGDGPPAFEVKERDKHLPYVLVIAIVISSPKPSVAAVLPASRALVIRTVLRARTETVLLIVTIVAAVLPTSKALVVGVALEVECVFLRVIVTGGQSNRVIATRAASIKTAII